ncbi:hypothetical protein BaRGS_00013781 [Batillaria attramentaria]|uniref:Uncharacterized protein n=1 Tax=Batillaria attramentaria TaxID=370345 RepID=A0ABD0L6A8_9CAEN
MAFSSLTSEWNVEYFPIPPVSSFTKRMLWEESFLAVYFLLVSVRYNHNAGCFVLTVSLLMTLRQTKNGIDQAFPASPGKKNLYLMCTSFVF